MQRFNDSTATPQRMDTKGNARLLAYTPSAHRVRNHAAHRTHQRTRTVTQTAGQGRAGAHSSVSAPAMSLAPAHQHTSTSTTSSASTSARSVSRQVTAFFYFIFIHTGKQFFRDAVRDRGVCTRGSGACRNRNHSIMLSACCQHVVSMLSACIGSHDLTCTFSLDG